MKKKFPILIFIISILLYGGFYDWNICVIGLAISQGLILTLADSHKVHKKGKNYFLYIPDIILLISLCIFPLVIDKSYHLSGIIRLITIILIIRLVSEWEEDIREELLTSIPYIGSLMVIIGLISLPITPLYNYFYRADRFGGFFQYANTCALFLAVGLLISYDRLSNGKTSDKRDYYISMVNMILLFIGMLMTGSRSVMLVTIIAAILILLKTPKRLGILLAILSVTAGLGLILRNITGKGSQNFARLFTLASSNSTLYGRLLYDIDGLKISLKHPLGLGYMGYYYVQHSEQSGVYTTRFVHNDFLQMGLDYGIIAMLLFIVFMGLQLFAGKQNRLKKQIMGLVLFLSLMDFHLQYMSIAFLLILCMDLTGVEKKLNKGELTEGYILCGLISIAACVLFIPYLASYRGDANKVLQFLQNNTQANVELMNKTGDKAEAMAYADKLISRNPYVTDAYNVKAYGAIMDGDLAEYIANEDKIIELEKYDIKRYEQYDGYLTEWSRQAITEDELETIELKRKELRQKLENLATTTSPLAYKLRDKPEFSF